VERVAEKDETPRRLVGREQARDPSSERLAADDDPRSRGDRCAIRGYRPQGVAAGERHVPAVEAALRETGEPRPHRGLRPGRAGGEMHAKGMGHQRIVAVAALR
jgi:hypothetical protein